MIRFRSSIVFIILTLSLCSLLTITSGLAPQDTAICPPTAWITCGKNPPDPLVCETSSEFCCWVSYPDTENKPYEDSVPNWVSTNYYPTHEYTPYSLGIERHFDPDTTKPVLEIEYDWTTRIIRSITCNYLQQNYCSGTSNENDDVNSVILFSLRNTVPYRYQVPEAYYDFVRMTVDGIGTNVCDCENVLALSTPNRYGCCLWEGGLPAPFTNPKKTIYRTFSCKAPGTQIEPDIPCSHVLRFESQCGDTGGCFCRLEYAPQTPTENREPWDCDGCCRTLTGHYDIDFSDARNDTRFDCLANIFNTAPIRNYCESKFQFPRTTPTPVPSDASNESVVFTTLMIPLLVLLFINCVL